MLARAMTERRRFRRLFSLVSPATLAVFSLACGSAPPAPPVTAVVVHAPPPAPPIDRTPVPAPTNLILFGRVKNASATVKVATDWARLPSLEASTLFEGFVETVMSSKDYGKLSAVVDTAQAIDFASSFEVKLPPKAYFAFSAAVTDIDAAKSALAPKFDLVSGDPGVSKLVPHMDTPSRATPEKSDEGGGPACELAPSAGASAFRLVCASSHDALSALGAYLTRTTPGQTIPGDVHVELHAGPVGGFATLGRLQGMSILTSALGLDPEHEPATSDLVTAVVGDFFEGVADLDAITLDATLDPAHAALSYRTTFKSATSLVAKLVTAHPERVDVPPEAFWRLPADVDLATFGSGVDGADLQHPRELVLAAIDEQLKKQKIAEGDRRAMAQTVTELIHGERGAFAHGMADGTSYWLMEQDALPATSEKMLRDLVATWNRPAVAKWLKADEHAGADVPLLKLGGALPGLPRDAVHVIITVPAESATAKKHAPGKGGKAAKESAHPPLVAATNVAAPKTPPDVYHLVVIPDGARSWFAISTSEAALRKALASFSAKNPDTLGAHATERGLDGFKDTRMSAGAYLTVRAFIEMGLSAMTGKQAAEAKHWEALLAHLPAKGVTPITVTSAPLPPTADDAGGVRELRLNMPAESIRDAVWFALQLDP